MANKYPGWSPYSYFNDNPLAIIDPNGDSVVINNVDWQNDLRNTVPKELRQYVQLDDKGMLNIGLLKGQNSDDINFKALVEVGGTKEIINISEPDQFEYKDCDGNIITNKWPGFTGFTTAPDNTKYSSVDNNINV
jgi:hypothetical protein